MANENATQKQLINDCSLCKFEKVERKEKNPSVLYTLRGPCMEINRRNRNNRIYSEQLIRERIAENPDVREKMKNKQLLGEGDHPEERTSVSYPMVALSVTDLWIPKDDPSHLWGEFDILATSKGKDLAAIIDYAGTIGISARALGSHFINSEGVEVLETRDYDFITFDAVPDPGFQSARLSVKESLDKGKDKDLYSEKSIRELEVVLENYRSYATQSVSEKQSKAGLGEDCKEVKRVSLPSSIVESSREMHESLRFKIAECEKLKSEKRFLLSQISGMQVGLDKANVEIEEMKRLTTSSENEKQSLKKKNELCLVQMRRMSDDLDVFRHSTKFLNEQLKKARASNALLTEHCESLSSNLSDVSEDHENAKAKLAESVKSERKVKDEVSVLKSHVMELESVASKYKEMLSKTSSIFDKKDSENESLHRDVSRLNGVLKMMERKIQEEAEMYEAEIAELTQKNDVLVRQLKTERKKQNAVVSQKQDRFVELHERQMERFRPSIKESQEVRDEEKMKTADESGIERWFQNFRK